MQINTTWDHYVTTTLAACRAVSEQDVTEVMHVLRDAAYRRSTIYVIGNGASAALSQHWACDHMKGASGSVSLSVVSLASNMAILTAIGNDRGYEKVFTDQLKHHTTESSRDVLVVISASGNSPNVVDAMQFVSTHRPLMTTIGITGFTGGHVRTLADYNLHIPIHRYEEVEDVHSMLMHVLARQLRQTLHQGAPHESDSRTGTTN